jgi:hypothetical protein
MTFYLCAGWLGDVPSWNDHPLGGNGYYTGKLTQTQFLPGFPAKKKTKFKLFQSLL